MHEKINYLEFQANDIEQTKAFFKNVFQWSFTDYGPDYVACANAGIDVGFYRSDQVAKVDKGSVLIVFFSEDLDQTLEKVKQAEGVITKPTFSFPGGRRFHFEDPNGNEFAVWAEPIDSD